MDNSISSCFENLVLKLSSIYDKREATNISRIIFEDIFSISNPNSIHNVFNLTDQKLLDKTTNELLQYKPWQYVVGKADFYGFKFNVDNNVLIPRPETEELVDLIIKKHKGEAPSILDIGTGSGCIAICLQYYLKNAIVTGVDICSNALNVARENAKKHSVSTRFKLFDILDTESTKKMPIYDIIVSNPPYIKNDERQLLAKHVLEHEPQLALFVSDNDPLQFYKSIVEFATKHLNHNNGCLYLETSALYGLEVLKLIKDKGFHNCALHKDLYGNNRIVLGSINKY